MSLIFADSLTRYGVTDASSAAPFLGRYGWSSSGNVHHKTGGHFNAGHLQTSGGSQGGKGAYWSAISRSITPTTSLGISLKCSPFSFLHAGSGQVADYLFLRMNLSNGHYIDLNIGLQHFHDNTYATGRSWTTNVNTMFFSYRGSPDLRDNTGSNALSGRRIDFAGKTMSVYPRLSSRDTMWTASFSTVNWMHLDFAFNTTTKLFSARLVFPDGDVFTTATTDQNPRYMHGNPIAIPSGLTITSISIYGNDSRGMKMSDLLLWTQNSVGLSSFPDSPRNLRVQRVFPVSNGTFNTWSPTSGTNVSMVNETPYSDTNISTGSGIGSKQTFLMDSLGSGTNSVKSGIHGIQLNPSIYDAGANVSIAAPIQVIGGTETSLGSGIVPNRVSYTVPFRVITINPQTSGQYTASEINAMETGFNIQ